MSSRNTQIKEEKHAHWPTEYNVLGEITKGTMGHLSIDASVEIKEHCQTCGKLQPSNQGESYMMHERRLPEGTAQAQEMLKNSHLLTSAKPLMVLLENTSYT